VRRLADELSYPKYSHIERERRWLVIEGADALLEDLECVRIEDRYITSTRLRLRGMTDVASGERSLKLTKKYQCDHVLTRPMVTAYLDDGEYALLQKLPASLLTKRRYTLFSGAAEWSIDCFEGALDGLRTAEHEAATDAALHSIQPPEWVGQEVTGDVRYQGAVLAHHGMPERS
jgi:CYTH domain-containing protein